MNSHSYRIRIFFKNSEIMALEFGTDRDGAEEVFRQLDAAGIRCWLVKSTVESKSEILEQSRL